MGRGYKRGISKHLLVLDGSCDLNCLNQLVRLFFLSAAVVLFEGGSNLLANLFLVSKDNPHVLPFQKAASAFLDLLDDKSCDFILFVSIGHEVLQAIVCNEVTVVCVSRIQFGSGTLAVYDIVESWAFNDLVTVGWGADRLGSNDAEPISMVVKFDCAGA